MRVFLTGATGVLGRRVVDGLTDCGHEVVGLVRDDAGVELVDELGGVPRRGDVLDREAVARAAGVASGGSNADGGSDADDGSGEEFDVAIHAATALPTATKPSDEDWARNDRVREVGARNVVEVLGDGVDRLYFPSVVWLARRDDGEPFDEDASPNPDRATLSAATVERFLDGASDEHGFEPCVLRFGFFYAPDAAHTRRFAESLLSRDLPIVGGGLLGRRDATLSWIHADDAGAAMVAAVDEHATGLYHVVDEEPATVATVFRALADRLDAPAPRRLPGWLARLFVGAETVRMLTNSMPTTARQFREAVDWIPTYPTYREGLDQVVETWIADGTIREADEGYEWVDD